MTQAFTKWEKTASCYSYICIYIWLLRCYYCSVVRISDFPNGRIVVITFMEPPHLLAQCALKFDLLCPNICMRWGLSPNITLHIPTLINRKILFVGLGRRGKESKHHSGRNPRQKVLFSWAKMNPFLVDMFVVYCELTYNQHQRRFSWILYYRVSFSGIFSNTVQSHYYTLIAGLLLCYLPLFGYHRRCCCCCVPHGLEHRWKQIVLEREALRPCISNSHLVVALRAAMPGM